MAGETYKDLQNINNSNFSGSPTTTSQMNNITPVNPINLKGIDPRDSGGSYLSRKMSGDEAYSEQNKSVASPFASDYFNTKIWGFDIGAVTDVHKNKYSGLNPYSKAVDFEHLRRQEQSGVSSGINLFNQFIGKTAINTIGGIVGGFYGIGSAIANQDMSKLYDNSVNRALDKGTDWVEENNNVFTSQKGRDNATLGFLSFETMKDMGDAFSFISGAIASEVLIGTATGGLGLATAPGRLASKMGYLGRTVARAEEAVGLGNGVRKTGNYLSRSNEIKKLLGSSIPEDVIKLQQIAKSLGSSVDDLARNMKTIDGFNSAFRTGRGVITGTFWEAGLEARHTKDELMSNELANLESEIENINFNSEEEKEAYRQNAIKQIEDVSNTAGLVTFGLNTAVLGVSNAIQFPTIFGPKAGYNGNRMKGMFSKKGLNDYVNSGGKVKDITRTVASILKSPITEFTEETLQGVINKGSKSYYETMLGTRTSTGELNPALASVSDALMTGLKETYGTKEGLYEGVIGALVGGLGAPSISRNKKGKLRPTIEGGIAQSIRDSREVSKSIKESLDELNLDKFDTLLSYNKDNTIISLQDTKKETLAGFNEDKFEVERLNDNKVFRYVKNMLDKGLESYMPENSNELKNLSLEEYKVKFQKDDEFTQEQKDKEVNDFESKVQIYSDAYKKVFNGLQLDKINNNQVSKKYFETLAYAVANEKIYKQRQNELLDKLLSNKNVELSYEELLQNAVLSDKFKNHSDQIDDLIKLKKLELEKQFAKKTQPIQDKIDKLKSKIDKKYHQDLDNVINNDEDTIGYLKSVLKTKDETNSKTYQELIANSEEIFASATDLQDLLNKQKEVEKLREKETKVNTGQFGPIRSLKEQTKAIAENIRKDIEKNSSKALEKLRGKKETATQKELEDYIVLKQKASEALNKNNQNNQNSFLDSLNENNEELSEMFDELANITKHQVQSLEIASNLYGLNNSTKAYSTIANAQFSENQDNIERKIKEANDALTRQDDENEIVELSADLERSIINVREDLIEFNDLLLPETIEDINNLLNLAEETKSSLDKYLDTLDKKEDIANKTKNEDKINSDKKAVDSVLNKEKKEAQLKKEVDEESEGIVENVEFNNKEITFFNNKNLHTIKPTNTNQPELVELKEKLNSGVIKYNSAVVLNYLESNEETEGFKNYLKKDTKKPNRPDITSAYFSGKDKIIEDPSLLEKEFTDLDPDVITFITHAPVQNNIYNKQVEIYEGSQEFDIEQEDVPEHSFLYFSEEIQDINEDAIEKYNNLKESLNNELNDSKNKIDKELKDKTISKEEYNKKKFILERNYQNSLRDLEAKAFTEINSINAKVLFNFRKALLYNKYNNSLNELKMRIGNILNGYIEKSTDTETEVEEFGLTSDNGNDNFLINNSSEITRENLLFGNKDGEYRQFDGDTKANLNPGSKVTKTTAQTGAVYLAYKTINGQSIPVLLNRAKIGSNEKVFNEVSYQLEQYFINGIKQDATISLKDKSMSVFENKTYKQFFESFFNRSNTGQNYSGIDTLNIVSTRSLDKAGVIYLGNLTLEINSLETFNSNKENILNAIADMRFYLNKTSLTDIEDNLEFKREELDFFIKEKLINHNFNTKKNQDKIFLPGFDKSIQIHILDSEVPKSIKAKSNKLRDVKNTLNKLLGQDKKENISPGTIFYNLNSEIILESTKNWKETGNAEESILNAFDTVIERKLVEGRKFIDLYPNEYRTDESKYIDNKNITLTFEDGALDSYFKALYIYKNKFKSRKKTIKVFEEYLESKNYNGNFKNILLDKKLSLVKMMLSKPIQVEETVDGKTTSKTKFGFDFNEELTQGTPEENKDKFTNIINAFTDLQKSARTFIPQIYNNTNDKNSSLSKVYLDFSKSFISNEGKVNENLYYHTVDKDGNVSKGTGTTNADVRFFNLAQTNPKVKLAEGKKRYEAIEFKFKNSKGELEVTRTPLTDFQFDSNGELTNGVIYITYNNAKGFPEQQPVMIGKENNLNVNNFIKTIKIPGLNPDFTFNKNSSEMLNTLFNRFDTAIDNLNKETVKLFNSDDKKSAINKDIKIEDSYESESEQSDKETMDELNSSLLNSINKKQPENNTSDPVEVNSVAEEVMDNSLGAFLVPGEYDPEFNDNFDPDNENEPEIDDSLGYIDENGNWVDGKINNNTEDSDKEELYLERQTLYEKAELVRGKEGNEFQEIHKKIRKLNSLLMGYKPVSQETGLSYADKQNININESIYKLKLDRLNSMKASKDQLMLLFNDDNINNYTKFIELVNIIYKDNLGDKNKFTTFVNKLFNKTKKDSDKIAECK